MLAPRERRSLERRNHRAERTYRCSAGRSSSPPSAQAHSASTRGARGESAAASMRRSAARSTRFATRDCRARVPLSGGAEVMHTAESFNEMTERLDVARCEARTRSRTATSGDGRCRSAQESRGRRTCLLDVRPFATAAYASTPRSSVHVSIGGGRKCPSSKPTRSSSMIFAISAPVSLTVSTLDQPPADCDRSPPGRIRRVRCRARNGHLATAETQRLQGRLEQRAAYGIEDRGPLPSHPSTLSPRREDPWPCVLIERIRIRRLRRACRHR